MASNTSSSLRQYTLSTEANNFEFQALLDASPPPNSVAVEYYWNCPNIKCNVNFPHTIIHTIPVMSQPSDIPTLHIKRFDPNTSPFPQQNVWDVATEPTFSIETGCKVFLEGYGIVQLQEHGMDEAGYKSFVAHNNKGHLVARVVCREEWRHFPSPAEPYRERGIFSFLRFFGC